MPGRFFGRLATAAALAGAVSAQTVAAETPAPKAVLPDGKTTPVTCAVLDASRQELLAGYKDGTIVSWDVDIGAKRWHVLEHGNEVTSLSVVPGTGVMLSGSADASVILWDRNQRKAVFRLAAPADRVNAVAFHCASRYAYAAHADGQVAVWDTLTGALRAMLPPVPSTLAAFTEDGGRALIALPTYEFTRPILWDTASGQILGLVLHDRDRSYGTCVAVSPDGSRMAVGSSDGPVVVFDGQKLKRLGVLKGHPTDVRGLSFSADGTRLLSGSNDGQAILWDTDTGRKLHTLQEHKSAVISVWLSPDGKTALTGSSDQTAILWNAGSGKAEQVFRAGASVWGVACSQDPSQVATSQRQPGAGKSATIVLWDAKSGSETRKIVMETDPLATVLTFSPDGHYLLTASGFDKCANLWNARTGEKVRTFSEGLETRVTFLRFADEGRQVLTGCCDGSLARWDRESGRRLAFWKPDHGSANCLAQRTGGLGRGLVIAYASGMVCTRHFDPPSYRAFAKRCDGVVALAIAEDAYRVLTGSRDKTAVLWDEVGGYPLRTFSGHTGGVLSVALTGDAKLALTGSADKTAIVWNTANGKPVQTLRGHTDKVTAVMFHEKRGQVFTGSADGTLRVWDMKTGKELGRLMAMNHGRDWLVTTTQGYLDGSPDALRIVEWQAGKSRYPFQRYQKTCHRPDLVARVLQGLAVEEPIPSARDGSSPRVREGDDGCALHCKRSNLAHHAPKQ